MGAGKSRLEGATMQIAFEGDSRAFDANHPIIGTINVNCQEAIPAYGIELKLELVDMSKEVDYGDKGQRYPHIWKRRVWEKRVMVHNFENNLCNFGASSFPFQFDVPADLPQSLIFCERWAEARFKLRYFLKAQLVPVNVEMTNNEWGKCKLRDRQRVAISPVRPIVNDPKFQVPTDFHKKVGLMSSKHCDMTVTFAKNFYLAGETAYMMVNVDNSKCSDACSLEISQKSKVQMYQSWRKYDVKRTHKKETFFLCAPGESKQLILSFNIAAKRRDPQGTNFFKHPEAYHHQNTLVPESMYAQTFSVLNYLEIYLTHEGTVFSNDSTKKYYFQLIQPSLVPGIIEPPPPLFLDTAGNPIQMENPVIEAPQGEVVQGTAVDIGQDDKGKKGKDVVEEEPTVGQAQAAQ